MRQGQPRSADALRRVARVLVWLLIAVVLVAPLTLSDQATSVGIPALVNRSQLRILTTIAMFVVLASAWNIIGGIGGYAAFGNVAFFGLGAYTTALLVERDHAGLPFAVGLLAAPVVPALFAAAVGSVLLRLRGHYFAVATLGTSIALGEVIKNIDYFGGSTGLFPPILARADLLFFYLMAASAGLAVGTTWLILRSRFGYGLIAIRENEQAAAILGVDTTRYKVLAFSLSAALTGLAGGVFAQWNSFISQDNVFAISYNVEMILMATVGGAGTLLGPVVGAAALESLILALAGGGASAAATQVGLGVLLAVTVIFLPRGVIDFFGGRSRLSRRHLRASLRETSA
jgi:branched-chain amino acid transport system permease protein